MDRHAGSIRLALLGLLAGQSSVGIRAMDDLDMVSAPGQFVSELLHEDRVAAEVVGRVEGGEHAEAQSPGRAGIRAREKRS